MAFACLEKRDHISPLLSVLSCIGSFTINNERKIKHLFEDGLKGSRRKRERNGNNIRGLGIKSWQLFFNCYLFIIIII